MQFKSILNGYALILLLLLCEYNLELFAQRRATGALLDSAIYAKSPIQAPLMRGDYFNLPQESSLKMFAPTPGNQGLHGTCAGWATAYSARSILEALKNNWKQKTIDSAAFSPSFVYNLIRKTNDCSGGTSITDALDVLREKGVLSISEFGYDCERGVREDEIKRANDKRILEYRLIASIYTKNQTSFVKKSLSEKKPVVAVLDIPPSFENARELLMPDSTEYETWGNGHAVGVVGYDDWKFGGAFEIMNSWGKEWGKEGFTWVRYADFDYFCMYAFDLIDFRTSDPDIPTLSGNILFQDTDGIPMKCIFNGSFFVMEKPYRAGTMFDLRIANNQPAYFYAFSSDLTGKVYKIFPFNERMVPYLPYKQSNIAIPDEDHFNMLDEITGKTYFCFLYSAEILDIDRIIRDVERQRGGFYEKIFMVLRELAIDQSAIEFNYKDRISFSAKGKGKKLIPIVVEIQHIK